MVELIRLCRVARVKVVCDVTWKLKLHQVARTLRALSESVNKYQFSLDRNINTLHYDAQYVTSRSRENCEAVSWHYDWAPFAYSGADPGRCPSPLAYKIP